MTCDYVYTHDPTATRSGLLQSGCGETVADVIIGRWMYCPFCGKLIKCVEKKMIGINKPKKHV